LFQLAQGLGALHRAGRVHRDVKPSNILVTTDDRLVLIDFGLVADLEAGTTRAEARAIGTTAYMAPEQAEAKALGPAADWYSVGVLLYQSLTGRLPFEGMTAADIVRKKATSDPIPPRVLVPTLPGDLSSLCTALLRRDPSSRPLGHEVLSRLTHSDLAPSSGPSQISSTVLGAAFVGRRRELAVLQQAYADSRGDQGVTLLVHGASGIGKTTLVKHFVHSLELKDRDCVLLSGRCYERESLPYKAVDGVIDALGRYLARLPKHEAGLLLPARIDYLAQVFPALRQIDAVANLPRPTPVVDPHELRSRALSVLRGVLTRVATTRSLVVAIDDFQWADADSVALLRSVLRPPDAPPLLLLCTVRGDPQAWPGNVAEFEEGLDVRHVGIEPLPADDARELAAMFLRQVSGAGPEAPSLIAGEAGGHPLFIAELAYHSHSASEIAGTRPSLDAALEARAERLEPPVRRLLELCALAGGPIPQRVLASAAGSDPSAFDQHLSILRVNHLARTTGAHRGDLVEPYHDRVREALLASLSAETQAAGHQRLAVALEAHGPCSPEILATHYQGAGHRDRAAELFALAADAAIEALAFDHAARLYQLSLELDPTGDARARELRIKLGEALANAGRAAEAARQFLDAIEGADPARALDLTRRAAENYLTSGHVEEGLALTEKALAAVGMRLPGSQAKALWSILRDRLFLSLRGTRHRPVDESQVPRAVLSRIDILHTVSIGLIWVDLFRSQALATRHNVLAFRAGEQQRVIRALCFESNVAAVRGQAHRAIELAQLVESMAQTSHRPDLTGLAMQAWAVVELQDGRWRLAVEHCRGADRTWREQCTGVRHMLFTVHTMEIALLYNLGQLAELRRVAERYLAEAEVRDDRLELTVFRTCEGNVMWLVDDDPREARKQALEATRMWYEHGTLVRVYGDLLAQGNIDLYEEPEGQAAWTRVSARWAALRRTMLLEVPLNRANMHWLRARAALAAAAGTQARPRHRFLSSAAGDARRLAREPMPFCQALAQLIGSSIAVLRGDPETGARLADEALAGFEATDMALLAAAARRQRGLLLGGTEGQGLVAQADVWMANEGVVHPARMAAMLAPMGQAARS
jgi:tetratricopeptide (TPR) repeat protein